MKQLKVALDWTPNINHIGFFIAHKKGFYKDAGLEVKITTPEQDNYQLTPAKKVELGQADFALCPTESIISYRTKDKPFPLIAIAALLQADLSAIVVKSESGIKSPKDLDGKTYASYQARYEDSIVREMIKNDGGTGELHVTYPKKLGIWDTVLKGETDATWIFNNWEGVEAKTAGLDLNYFHLKDYRVPYSYSPVLAANAQLVSEKKDVYRSFLQATKQGYLYCSENKAEAIDILRDELPQKDKDFNLSLALDATCAHFGDEESWGFIKEHILSDFVNWIKDNRLESKEIELTDIFTNACLP